MPLPHLDRFFDYTVPEVMRDDAVLGARVRVRFAGRLCGGFIVGLPETSDAPGRLAPLAKVVSPEPVLTAHQITLIRAVADHYAGTFADVVRLAVAPRHAATEKAAPPLWPEPATEQMPPGGLAATPAGAAWLRGVDSGRPLRGFWAVPPCFSGDDGWQRGVVQAVVACLRAGHGAIVVVPHVQAMDVVQQALEALIGKGCVARLHAQMGPAQRYHDYLAVARGQAKVVVGTRSAVFAPMDGLGLIVLVDDGNDLYSEPRAPYPHARTVAALRASQAKCALLLAGAARSCEAQNWVERGWLGAIEQTPERRRAEAPAMRTVADEPQGRLPVAASQAIRAGLSSGPVLVQVPRAGYLPSLACQRCGTPVRCPDCHGPVAADRLGAEGRRLSCRWCGRVVANWRCQVCEGQTLRAPVVGAARTAEELGRSFPGFRVIDSSGDHVVERVGERPALVVATPGAEPMPDAGYAAAVLLDADRLLARADLRSAEEAVRRWFAAVSLVRPGSQDGTVCVVGDSAAPAVQALLRVDPAGFATRELQERRQAGFPPAVVFAEASGEPASLAEFCALLPAVLASGGFGPIDVPGDDGAPRQRMLWRCEVADAPELVDALKTASARRSAAKAASVVRVQIDPVNIG